MQLPKCVAVSFGIIVHLTYILSCRFGFSYSLIVPISMYDNTENEKRKKHSVHK
nr:MAG TPA: hypothetical protein [Caudoviricetes sp.]